MLLRFSSWLMLGTLLTACQPDLESGPLLDFVGGSRYTAYTRVINTPADTLTFKIFAATTKAQGNDTTKAPKLTNMKILVTYSPRITPIDYQNLTAPNLQYPYGDPTTLTVFDQKIERRTFAFQNTFSTRSTPGRETWRFDSTDDEGHTSTTSFQITVRPSTSDSTLTYHRYTVGLQAPRTFTSRSYLALLPGLTFPRYIGSGTDSPGTAYSDIYRLIDLVYLPGADNSIVLASPSAVPTQLSPLWPTDSTTRRTTRLRNTNLNASTFAAAASPADLTAAYTAGTSPAATRTENLVKGRVYAFRTQGGQFGLIYVENIITTPIPAARLQVHITK
ncbi:hypothetical protein MUN82_17560 [Hymenobacter aerilatus]|uniref:Uncharacterized protein n=1 Tax=Hymenobacter aerilatus TaxID=2932251 RepID=A0A8T9SVJ6_9BACT|nr:hypothetical protein [Hymenobacter aerilatus]UOR04743.1 hypothetical protein MUN82_17560 [Hymenobacter aerilatus]